MNFEDKMVATIFGGVAAVAVMTFWSIHKQNESDIVRPLELSQVFRCVQPTGDLQFTERSGRLMQVKNQKTGEEFYEVQLDKTSPPPSGHDAWGTTRVILGEPRVGSVDEGVKVAVDFCIKNEIPPGAAYAKPVIQ